MLRFGKFGKFGISKGLDARESKTDFRVEEELKFNQAKFDQQIEKMSVTKSRINYLKNHARKYSLLRIFPKTGRTHQIRVHIKSLGNPAVSDLIYAPKKLLKFDLLWCPRLFLHAASLEFKHPRTAKEVQFTAPLPKDLKDAILYLDKVHA